MPETRNITYRPTHVELTVEQIGHLRHFANLLAQPPNDWSFMQSKRTGQDDFGGYRFQLAYMAYALALTHQHRLPAAPGVFKPLIAKAIEKILLPEVWLYWKDTSRGGGVFNSHLSHNYKEQYDPVARDNIMYSAYVQSMALLFNYLFDDDRYARPGGLTFDFYSAFWGGERKRFEYDQNSLNEHLYWLMMENGYLGIACEPNCIYQICNQPAIFGFRLHDIVSGGSIADEVTRGYQQAWADFGILSQDGHYNMFVFEDSKALVPNQGRWPWVDAWCGALMNMWNRDFVRSNYSAQMAQLIERGRDGTLSVNPGEPFMLEGEVVTIDTGDHGWAAAWAAEMGDTETLDGLLAHADRYMKPTWMNGGLYYPRNDRPADDHGNRTMMEPVTGNILLGYARLNVPDGMWKLYNEPWGAAHYAEPALVEVDPGIDVSLAYYDRDTAELHFALQGTGEVVIGNLNSTHVTVREGDTVIGRGLCDGEFRSEQQGIRPVPGGLALNCADGKRSRYTVSVGDRR